MQCKSIHEINSLPTFEGTTIEMKFVADSVVMSAVRTTQSSFGTWYRRGKVTTVDVSEQVLGEMTHKLALYLVDTYRSFEWAQHSFFTKSILNAMYTKE